MKENGREIKRAPVRERETVKEINLGLWERLEVSEAAANTHTQSHTRSHTRSDCDMCVGFIHSSFEHLGMCNSSIVHTSVWLYLCVCACVQTCVCAYIAA